MRKTKEPGNGQAGLPAEITLTDAERMRVRELGGSLDRLKIALADLTLQMGELEDRRAEVRSSIRSQMGAIGSAAREIASAHGVDVDGSGVRWHLDLGSCQFTRTG